MMVFTVNQSDVTVIRWYLCTIFRCQAPSHNLDSEESIRQHTQEITEALVNTYDVATLWSEHGIVSDIVVSVSPLPTLSTIC